MILAWSCKVFDKMGPQWMAEHLSPMLGFDPFCEAPLASTIQYPIHPGTRPECLQWFRMPFWESSPMGSWSLAPPFDFHRRRNGLSSKPLRWGGFLMVRKCSPKSLGISMLHGFSICSINLHGMMVGNSDWFIDDFSFKIEELPKGCRMFGPTQVGTQPSGDITTQDVGEIPTKNMWRSVSIRSPL